ncbi:MAG: type VI secretion system contractile sheath large subunit, partial [Acidobacteriota bacterium]|nr:type VI secretion system contractile sheath large subunit [Acidobacteriota bacterium]
MNPERTNLEAEVSMERAGVEIPEDPPFHILVLGDFSGHSESVKPFRIRQIDRDDVTEVMARIAPKVSISTGDTSGIGIGFRELDDFHPDSLFKSVAIFDELRSIRGRLKNESTFKSAATEVREWFSDEGEEPAPAEEIETPVEVEGGEGLLEDILGSRTREAAAYKRQKSTPLKDFVKEVVDPFLVKVDEEEQAKLISAVDDVTGGIMRKILRDKAFRALEAAWRGLYMICRKIETSTKLKIFVLDIGKERFIEEIKKETSTLSDLLLGGSSENENEPWAVIAGAYDFDLTVEDVAALMRVGAISGVTGSPFVSHVRPGMLGIRSFADHSDHKSWDTKSDTAEGKLWTALRASEHATSIGMVAPRLLARLPYGEETDPTEVFSFEECDGRPEHDDYLWMNPVFGF